MTSDFYKIETLSEMFKFLNIPNLKHPLITLIDYSKTPLKLKLPKHKFLCNFYQISFKSDQNGFVKYGRETYDYQEGTLIYVAPNQVVEYGNSEKIELNSGWTLFFHADLIRSFSLDKKMKEYNFFNYQSNEALHISEKEKEIIESIIYKIQIELDSNLDDFSEEVIVSNLELLFNYSKRFYNRQFITRKRFNSDIITLFSDELDSYFEKNIQKESGIPTTQYFAKKLNYSPNYLNELIKKQTGKSISEHINYKILELAKSSLLNSSKTVSEIAFELGFSYSQYFSRFFKKNIGKTPNEYRKSS
ncbi:helix-turn-helix domain-containing protein [Aureivirga marina]|uniref:helix-turn-helix domain-containing protein n=1 Tax=Aureivirga marina TaxID=1182451 RepID=UPI0018C92F87|nr:helix-turn-helix transcriptional regulator [Aureivirga marina]